jgi:hypothetical protein
LFEQQSPAVRHASPRVLQPSPPGSGAQALPVQIPVQHWAPEVQASPWRRQAVPPHAPPVHESMQHSPEDAQGVPGGLQNDAATHVPVLSHSPEQHWLSSGSQAAPLARHTVEGEAQRPAARSQNPEQQSASCPHERNSSAQVPSGSVQTPFAQALVQQVAPERQVPPAAVHAAGSTQRPPAQAVSSAWQQSDGTVQPVPPRGMHAFAVQPFAPSQKNPMQQ